MRYHLFQFHTRNRRLGVAACLAAMVGAAGVSCTESASDPSGPVDWTRAAPGVDGPLQAPAVDAPIEVVRHLQHVVDHGSDRSGDYYVEWSFSLARPRRSRWC